MFNEIHSVEATAPLSDLDNLVRLQPPTPKKGRPRNPYSSNSLHLSDADAGWLGAIIDGEGSVFIKAYPRRGRKSLGVILGVTVCYNTDSGIICKAAKLIPWANIRVVIVPAKKSFNKSKSPKPCYGVETAQRDLVYDLLSQILPHLSHTGKKARALEILTYIDGVRQRRIRRS